MTKKTYEEYLLQTKPELVELAKYYADLGMSAPVLWAEAETKGDPTVATCLFTYVLGKEINKADDHGWIAAVKGGDINVDSESLCTEAADALLHAEKCGIDLTRLTPLVRAIQTQCVKNFVSALDEGPELLCLPLPEGREVSWQLYEVKKDESIGNPISGLHNFFDGEES
ncbi:MAG: hypothetical protein HYS18_11140 [Burkholderiales bacterium]|nr:hypothetical protein [Burkholderiales bacterium]